MSQALHRHYLTLLSEVVPRSNLDGLDGSTALQLAPANLTR